MSSSQTSKSDFIRELRLRQWARQHHVAVQFRKATWHPVVLGEMNRRDQELLGKSLDATDDDSRTSLDSFYQIRIDAAESSVS